MTNREKLKEVFPYTIFICRKENDKTNAIMCTDEWLDSEYIEPTTKNNLSSGLEKTRKKLEKDFGELDCISRKRAIERLKLNFPISQGADNSRDRHRYMQALADLQAIKELPSVTPQEPQTFKWCTDCREYDQEKHCCHRWSKVIRDTVEEMKQEEEPKTGHWTEEFNDLEGEVRFTCSCCGKYQLFGTDFCYHCGAKMVEPQESEEE